MTRRAWSLFVAISLLWGMPYWLIKVAVAEVPPVFVVFVRTALAAAVLLPIAFHRGVLRSLLRRWRMVAGLSLVQILLPFALIAFGERYVTSSLTGILIAAEPLLIAVLAVRFDPAERVRGLRLVGLVVGFAGVVVLLGVDVGRDSDRLLGAAMVLGATLCYAVGALVAKRALADTSPLAISAAATTFTTVVLLPLAWLERPSHVPSAAASVSLLVLGLACTAVAFLVFYALIAEAGVSRAAVFTFVNPVVAVILGVIFLSEPVTAATLAGLVLVVAGSWTSTRGRPPLARRVRP